MIKREEFRKMDSAYPFAELLWMDNNCIRGKVALGQNLATPRQVKNDTEVYRINGKRFVIAGKAGKVQYLRRENNSRMAVLSSSPNRMVLYAHLYGMVEHLEGRQPRRNLFRNSESLYLNGVVFVGKKKVEYDPIDHLMQRIGYEV